jgi:hypothetical protein
MKTSVHLLKLFVGPSTLAGLAAWQKKKRETAKAESKPRELAHTRCCDPTELFPVLGQSRARLARGSSAPVSSGFQNACPLVQGRLTRVTSRQHQWQRGFRM